MVVNMDKSFLSPQDTIPALGYKLSHGNVSPTDADLKTITDFVVEQDAKSVRKFLGKLAMIHHLVPAIAKFKDRLFATLTKAKGRMSLHFTKADKEAIAGIKSALGTATHLSFIGPQPITMFVDSGERGMATTLNQEGRVIGQFVKRFDVKLLEHQSSPNREVWGIARTFEHFQDLLYNREVTVCTDHLNVIRMQEKVRQATPWLTRLWDNVSTIA
jgi:hypothetical protein